MAREYECVHIHEDGGGPHVVTLKGGGDVLRLECPPHEFGKFELGEFYVLELRKRERRQDCK
jgi:hypothetical protein